MEGRNNFLDPGVSLLFFDSCFCSKKIHIYFHPEVPCSLEGSLLVPAAEVFMMNFDPHVHSFYIFSETNTGKRRGM